MKLYALTSIEVDDAVQRLCGPDCPWMDGEAERCALYDAYLACARSGNPLRCPACLAATAIHPLIEAIKKAPVHVNMFDENLRWIYPEYLNREIQKAALDLKGKLK